MNPFLAALFQFLQMRFGGATPVGQSPAPSAFGNAISAGTARPVNPNYSQPAFGPGIVPRTRVPAPAPTPIAAGTAAPVNPLMSQPGAATIATPSPLKATALGIASTPNPNYKQNGF